MTSVIEKIARSYGRGGVRHVARSSAAKVSTHCGAFYRDRLRRRLPITGHAVWNGVTVAHPRRFADHWVPSEWVPSAARSNPFYENALVAALKETVAAGDSVVVVGGGFGVTAVTAARLVGSAGRVICYEAAEERLADLRFALAANDVAMRVDLEHAIVSEAISLFGTPGAAPVLKPEELPECDVLQLDCEGAEVEILQTMLIRPRWVLVETHGLFGAPTALVTEILLAHGYSVEDRGIAEIDYREFCEQNDIRILAASATS